MSNGVKNKIEVLVRAIIENKGKFLVCKKIGNNYYFFPGGHVNYGESAKEALARELKEELGISFRKCSFIGTSEHTFVEDSKKHHEINLAFRVPIKKISTKSRENHLQFFLMTKNQIAKEKVLPTALTKAILKWFKNPKGKPSASYGASKKPFWVSEI